RHPAGRDVHAVAERSVFVLLSRPADGQAAGQALHGLASAEGLRMSRATDGTPPGLVGVGLLGGAITERLLGAGFRVVGADVDPSRSEALRRLGGEAVGDPSEVFRACDRVLLSLPTSDVVAAVIGRVEAALRPGQVVIDTTTGAPRDAEAAGARLA